jgi:hypothetical protein
MLLMRLSLDDGILAGRPDSLKLSALASEVSTAAVLDDPR